MSLQGWVAKVLVENDDFGPKVAETATVVGRHELRVARPSKSDVAVYCADASDTEPFTPDDLDVAIAEVPALDFVVVVKRAIAAETYAHADEVGIPIGSVASLRSALSLDNVSRFRGREDAYVRSRLEVNAAVVGYRRLGATTYEIHRTGGLRDLTVAMIEPYELTADHAYALLMNHHGITLDAIVTTNPNCRGFSAATLEAVANAGTTILTFSDFLTSLRDPWDA